MKSIPDSLNPEQAWARLSSCDRLAPELRPLESCLDHCLAESTTVLDDVPAAPRSFRDGYAVRAADVSGAPARLRLKGEVAMGALPTAAVGPEEAVAIATGGYLPEGADAVVMLEDTRVEGGEVVVEKGVPAGENVQARAEDFRRGDLLFPAGHRLRPQDLAALATFGIGQVRVIRRPVLRVVSTGNELLPFSSETVPAGKIRETNSVALSGAARKFGFECEAAGLVPDDLAVQREAMEHALAECDVVLVSGGSSVGERDHTSAVIESFAVNRIHFHGLAVRPGHPTIFGSIGSRFVFGLPGHPVSSLVVFYQFVLPFLFHLSGESVDYPRFHDTYFRSFTASLQKSVKQLKSKTDCVRLRLKQQGGRWYAWPVAGKSASLSTMVAADGFTIVPPGDAVIPEGAAVKVHLFP